MQFLAENDFYKVARITGPSHNFLAIRLSEKDCMTTAAALPVRNGGSSNIRKDDVLLQVLSGLQSINVELNSEYHIAEVQFIPSDTESDSVYRMLTRELVRRIHDRGGFIVV